MNIQDFIQEQIDNPITSKSVPDLTKLWGQAQKIRDLGQTLKSADGRKTMTYTQLYYVPGLTTYCGIHGTPILTGYMSGCYLFRYRDNNAMQAAHVGTHDTNKEANDHAKDAWKNLVAQTHITDVFGYDPVRDVPQALIDEATKIGVPNIFGMWEGNGAVRVGVIARHHRGDGWTLIGVEPAPLRPWSSIRDDPKMV
jgi:hypothetical protein